MDGGVAYLILADLHGNREALEAVLAHATGRYDPIVCLGDLVGYGADPNFVVDWARENAAVIVRGNHVLPSMTLRWTPIAPKHARAHAGPARR
jgi:predicted phosphodiesterase